MNVAGNAEQPCVQVGVVGEFVRMLDGPQEGLLHDLLRLGRDAAQGQRKPVQLREAGCIEGFQVHIHTSFL